MMTTAIPTTAITSTSDGIVAAIVMSSEEDNGVGGGSIHSQINGGSIITEVIDLFNCTCPTVLSTFSIDTISSVLQRKYSQISVASKSTEMA